MNVRDAILITVYFCVLKDLKLHGSITLNAILHLICRIGKMQIASGRGLDNYPILGKQGFDPFLFCCSPGRSHFSKDDTCFCMCCGERFFLAPNIFNLMSRLIF